MTHLEHRSAVELPSEQGAGSDAPLQLLDAIPHGVLVARPDGFVEVRNRHLLEYTGPTTAGTPGFLDELHPEDRAQAGAAWARARATEQPGAAAGRLRRHDGAFRWFRLAFAPTRDAGRKVTRWVVTWTDIHDARAAAEARRDTEAVYESLFTLAPSGVVLNDAAGRILAFNDQAHEQLGYTREEFARLAIADIDADEGGEEVRRHIARILAAGGEEYEVHHRTKAGEVRDVLVRTRPVEMGGERRFLSVWQDITDRKRAMGALRESDDRKSAFLAVLSHELRNPLAPIRNCLHLLDLVPPGSAQAAHARDVLHRQTDHLARLVDDLLDVTRISRGKVELHRARIDAREVVRRTCDDHRTLFDGRGVALRTELAATPIWIDADPARLSQVVGNLLQNAAKFTPEGGTTAVTVAAADGCAEILVADDGLGMDPGQVDRMFEPFTQGERTLARTHGGLGLGLALVKSLVELHGGAVRARSGGAGQGAEFRVTLPTAAPPVAARAAPAPAPRAAARLVLVVEDNEDAADTLAEIVALGGHRVRIARDGRSGIALARELRPDVVLCDIGLPDVSGLDVARALRADPALRATRLVALSGYAQPEDRRRAAEAGFDAHLAKPAPLAEIQALLEAALGSS